MFSRRRPGKNWCSPCWSTPSRPRRRCRRCARSPSSPRPGRRRCRTGLGARVLTDPTPDGHRDPLNNAISAAEAAIRDSTPNVGAARRPARTAATRTGRGDRGRAQPPPQFRRRPARHRHRCAVRFRRRRSIPVSAPIRHGDIRFGCHRADRRAGPGCAATSTRPTTCRGAPTRRGYGDDAGHRQAKVNSR